MLADSERGLSCKTERRNADTVENAMLLARLFVQSQVQLQQKKERKALTFFGIGWMFRSAVAGVLQGAG